MILWALLALSLQAPTVPKEFYLTAKECERVQERKARPEDWGCVPWFLPKPSASSSSSSSSNRK